MRPYDAKTDDQVCALRRDNYSTDQSWILAGGDTVTLSEQGPGEVATQSITLSRREFNKLIGWYMRDQKPRPT